MSLHQCEALTLRTYPYSESHQIVVFLSREYGRLRTMAYGAKSKSGKGLGSAFQPLTHLSLSFSRKADQELGTVKDFEVIRAFPAYQLSWEVNLHFGYFAELLLEFSNENEEADSLFRLALAVLGAIDRVPVTLLARYLEFWLLQLEGVMPRLESRLPADLAEKTRDMMRCHPEKLSADTLSEGEQRRLEKVLEELIEYHLEKRLTAKKMLKELLG